MACVTARGVLFHIVLLMALLFASSFVKTSPVEGFGNELCPEGLWGNECQDRCNPGCRLGCDRKTGVCIGGCGPGWTGDNCKDLCPKHNYGHNCVISCGHCRDDVPCNIVTGLCSNGCMSGFRGSKCNLACEPYTWGQNCSLTCGHCLQACNTMTGQCPSSCRSGWKGNKCDVACPSGRFGLLCNQKCGHCAENTTCNHETGQCPQDCMPGWTGERCTEECSAGRFGQGCKGICGHCHQSSCDHVTGYCKSGCSNGFTGLQCLKGCNEGWFGKNCSQQCGHCNDVSKCDSESGICVEGCKAGWHGPFCNLSCTPGTYGENCRSSCGRCFAAVCNAVSGVCPDGCLEGWEGDNCGRGILTSPPSFHSTPTFPLLIIALVVAVLLICFFLIYYVVVRPRKTALRRLYTPPSMEHLSNAYEQIVGSPWELQRGQLSLGTELLGNGQFGQVKKGVVKIKGVKVPVAIKTLKDNASEKDKRDFLNEFSILKKVGIHPNVVCLVGACHIKGVMYVAMEFAKHGDLRTFLRNSRRLTSVHEYDNTPLPCLHTALKADALLKLALDTARGLQHLATKQIIHRDVAARNVLLGDKLQAKVADFGLSKTDQTYVKTSVTRVPVRWMAVESLFNNTYTLQSDVWSFGVLLWELFTLGGTPYTGIDSQNLLTYLREGNRLRKPRLCDQNMFSMMQQCWHEEPDRRPTISELTARLERMIENSQVYMNIAVQEESLYTEIDHEREN